MKVRVTSGIPGGGFSLGQGKDVYDGEVIDVSPDEAKRLIAMGAVAAVNPNEIPADQGQVRFPDAPEKARSKRPS